MNPVDPSAQLDASHFYFAIVEDEEGLLVWSTPAAFFRLTGRMADSWTADELAAVQDCGLRMVEDSQFEPEDSEHTAESLEVHLRECGFRQSADFTKLAFWV